MMEPLWLEHARSHIGLRETPGPKHNPTILKWLTKLGAWWREDETPWCGTFVAHCFDFYEMQIPKHWYRAKSWLDWGIPVQPCVGCVAVLDRGGGGHVMFPTAISATRILGIGGNQGNMVSEVSFDRNRVLGFRWPSDAAAPTAKLPALAGFATPVSRNEA